MLFLAGLFIYMKVGFVQWIIFCSLMYFYVLQDNNFKKIIIPDWAEINPGPIFGIFWIITILFPIGMFLTYISTKFTGYSEDYDDN